MNEIQLEKIAFEPGKSFNSEIGRVGIQTAPARMMRSAHTVAKTGR